MENQQKIWALTIRENGKGIDGKKLQEL